MRTRSLYSESLCATAKNEKERLRWLKNLDELTAS